jgi:hypothetical protein
MLSYKDLMRELYTPQPEDEKRFADKHVVKVTDYPGGDAETLKGTKKSPAKKKRLADMEKGEDEEVYEALVNVREDAALKERYGNNWRAVKYAQESAAVDLGESKVTRKMIDDLEDRNEHGMVALKLAQAYGTAAEVKKVQDINKRHNQRGHIEHKDQKERDAIISKYFKMTEEVELDESKSATGYDLYHKDFSSAMQHAYDHAKKKHGITIDPNEIDDKVASGPRKPSEGKTNTYRLKGDKGAIQVQVYNKGGSKPFELNMYKEEVDLDEAKIKVSIEGLPDIYMDGQSAGQIKMQLRKMLKKPDMLKDVERVPETDYKQAMRDRVSGKDKKEPEVDLDEDFKAGALPLKDGSSVNVSKEDARVLDALFKKLNGNNRKQMMVKVESNKKSFSEILAFATNVDERGN